MSDPAHLIVIPGSLAGRHPLTPWRWRGRAPYARAAIDALEQPTMLALPMKCPHPPNCLECAAVVDIATWNQVVESWCLNALGREAMELIRANLGRLGVGPTEAAGMRSVEGLRRMNELIIGMVGEVSDLRAKVAGGVHSTTGLAQERERHAAVVAEAQGLAETVAQNRTALEAASRLQKSLSARVSEAEAKMRIAQDRGLELERAVVAVMWPKVDQKKVTLGFADLPGFIKDFSGWRSRAEWERLRGYEQASCGIFTQLRAALGLKEGDGVSVVDQARYKVGRLNHLVKAARHYLCWREAADKDTSLSEAARREAEARKALVRALRHVEGLEGLDGIRVPAYLNPGARYDWHNRSAYVVGRDRPGDRIICDDPHAKHPPRVAVREGYEELAQVLDEALVQAQDGKGRERHGMSGERWTEQKMHRIPRMQGSLDGLVYQIAKKALECAAMTDPVAKHREALGVVVYAAGLAWQTKEASDRQKVAAWYTSVPPWTGLTNDLERHVAAIAREASVPVAEARAAVLEFQRSIHAVPVDEQAFKAARHDQRVREMERATHGIPIVREVPYEQVKDRVDAVRAANGMTTPVPPGSTVQVDGHGMIGKIRTKVAVIEAGDVVAWRTHLWTVERVVKKEGDRNGLDLVRFQGDAVVREPDVSHEAVALVNEDAVRRLRKSWEREHVLVIREATGIPRHGSEYAPGDPVGVKGSNDRMHRVRTVTLASRDGGPMTWTYELSNGERYVGEMLFPAELSDS